MGSWEWDISTNVVTWSDQQFRVFGYEPHAVQPTYELGMAAVHPDDRPMGEAAVAYALETGKPFGGDQRVVMPDGRVRIVHTRGHVIADGDGRPIRILGTSQDVTAQRQAEQARRSAEEQFRAFVETTSEWVWTLDLSGRLTYSNYAVNEILGYEPDDLLGTEILDLIHPDDREAAGRRLPIAVRKKQGWTGYVQRWRRRDGGWRYLESSAQPILDDRGNVIGFRGSERDITARRTAEEALRKTEERFQLAARATNDVLWDWEIVNGTIWRSEGVRTLFGHISAPDTLEGWMALVHPDDVEWIQNGLREFFASSRDTWTGEYRFKRADGTYAWVLDRGIVMRNEAGAPIRMIGSMIDLTERKEAERMKSDFVSFVSHQLRTPLAGMNWMLELAAEAEHLPPQASDYIRDARESAARLVSLVNDLLDIARLESGRTLMAREPIRLQDVTDSVLREMQTLIAERHHAVNFMADGPPAAVGDPQMIRQVIVNLLSNAVKYTPDGGRIDVRVTQQNGSIEWRVSDNGMGIPRAAQARLFEKFFRADNAVSKEAEGTGLGLHLVRLVIENAGGQVWCESEEGQGATFGFTLPVAQQGENR
jgi:PAS domain S-box-containing protein